MKQNPEIQTDQKVLDILIKHNIKKISTLDEINEIFDVPSSRTENCIIKTKRNTIILFDTPDYNSAYLHEMYDNLLSNKENITEKLEFPTNIAPELLANLIVDLQNKFNIIYPTIDIFYCDTPEVNRELFFEYFKSMYENFNNNEENQGKLPEFEFNNPPVILMLSNKTNKLFLDFEKFMPFNMHNIFGSFITIYDTAKESEQQEKVQ